MNEPDMDPLMDPTISLTDQISRVVHELFPEFVEEKIVSNDFFCFLKLLLCSLEIEIRVQLLEE
jgi:hypothetical protein